MTHDEMIAVIAAYRDGKVVEFRQYGMSDWKPIKGCAGWDFHTYQYRIKPEPREWYMVVFEDGSSLGYSDEDSAKRQDSKVIRVREVLDP